jgi:hypothetical protein
LTRFETLVRLKGNRFAYTAPGAEMNAVRRGLLMGVAGLALVIGAPAQDGPAEITQGFRAYIVAEPRFPAEDVRNRTGKLQDLVTDYGLNPVIAVFSRTIPADANHPIAALIAKLDEIASDDGWKDRRFGAYVVFLALKNEFRKDDTRDARIKEISQFVSGVMPKRVTIGLAEASEVPDGAEQPSVPTQVAAMGIAPEDDLVIVFYHNFHVIKRWKFKAGTPPGEADLAAIEAEVTKHLGPRKKKDEPKKADEPKKKEEPKGPKK